MKKTVRKMKKFVNDHEDAFLVAGAFVLAAAGSAAVLALATWAAQKEAERQKAEDDWTVQQNHAGKAVYRLADGSLIAVPPDQVS